MDDELAKNLLAIWQSELTAMAADRELRENWVTMVHLWARAANAAVTVMAHDSTPGSPLSSQSAGATSPHAAPDPRLDEVDALKRRVDELERRLAALLSQRPTGGPEHGGEII